MSKKRLYNENRYRFSNLKAFFVLIYQIAFNSKISILSNRMAYLIEIPPFFEEFIYGNDFILKEVIKKDFKLFP
ncbi:hypothetical protein OA85_06860 [Flavobacterium sp. AED]|nr:hypothetical protein OA85_06860 [Flavobacterium sp. AED]